MKQTKKLYLRYLCFFSLLLFGCNAHADLTVEKQRFELDNFVTFGGKTIKKVAVGWESYGQLNSKKDNVILITHYFTGNSHAAGKYSPEDKQAGYWDAIIGPGKAIDTQRYFVISVDSLANLAVHDPHVITTGPASIDPDSGKPYGLSFPVVTIRDFVNIQKAVLESLGITKLHAVIGPSMGSMQAIDWAATYPDWVPRMISVVGSGQADSWITSALERWAIPIKLDPNWQQGNYYEGPAPMAGLTAALMFITQDALSPEFFNSIGQSEEMNFTPLEEAPLQDIKQSHSIVTWLKSRAAARAELMDANHLLYLVRANQLFMAGHKHDLKSGLNNIQAKTLFLPAEKDLLLMPYLAYDAHQTLLSLGKRSQYDTLSGIRGHLEGVVGIAQKSEQIAAFLADRELKDKK
ncbi:MAG: homoserine O-acetyltransferase [Paraglaciecola sp.]|jgi:homoserine O-acetyltransferase